MTAICDNNSMEMDAYTAKDIANHLNIEHLRNDGAGEFVDRIDAINSLKNRISALHDTITVKERTLTRQLSEFPPGLKIPVPWMNHKEVPLDDAIPLFQARQKELYLDLRYLRDPCGENYEEFMALESHVLKHTVPQFKAHKERIQEQLKFAKEKKEIRELSSELRWLQREYLTFTDMHRDTISPEVQERLYDAEALIVLPDLKPQHESALCITKNLRTCTARINSVLDELDSIKHCFLKYRAIQIELIDLNNELKSHRETALVIPNEEGELIAMDFNRAYDERYARTEATKGHEDIVRYNLLMQIDSDFFPMDSVVEEIEKTSKEIEEQELCLDNQSLVVRNARTQLDEIAKKPSKIKSINQYCNDLLRLHCELLRNDKVLKSIENPELGCYFNF